MSKGRDRERQLVGLWSDVLESDQLDKILVELTGMGTENIEESNRRLSMLNEWEEENHE